MAILGKVLKRAIGLQKTLDELASHRDPYDTQKKTLMKLLKKAKDTDFGRSYNFEEISKSLTPFESFRKNVPVHDYNSIHEKWWHRTLAGEEDVCWPGKVNFYALSSGTSEAASKHIPITADMLKAIKRTSIRQILALAWFDVPEDIYQKGILMVGGSTHLNNRGHYYEGDLSGITAGNIPFWFQHFYKPGRQIARERDWNTKIDEIIRKANEWDIGIIVGVPAWIQIIIEKVISYYNVDHIHEIWPNLTIYVHGGVSFEPYKKGFEKLLGKPLTYIETYLASEGFIAFQNRPDTSAMRMVLNKGIFFEFVPFNSENFGADGKIVKQPKTLHISEVKEGEEYALLLSSCAGAWRYLIGDTIKFTSTERSEIIITGRTKHFLSLCGEHLSVDNMNKAIRMVSEEMNIDIKEFTVAGINYNSLFAHKWYIGTDDTVDEKNLKAKLDQKLCELNDDYKVERSAALKEILVNVIPAATFYDWMRAQGKEGGQNKFPRVMKKEQFRDWEEFVTTENV